ncbi:hypothetical protein D3C77_199770 [compost metagenome]
MLGIRPYCLPLPSGHIYLLAVEAQPACSQFHSQMSRDCGDRLLSAHCGIEIPGVGMRKAKTVVESTVTLAKKLDENRDKIADHADTAAKAGKLLAAATMASAAVAAPTGWTALGVAAGIVSAPAIVTAAPVIVSVASGAVLFSAAASLYAKARKRRQPKE